jgi:hypothetical protein
MALRDLRTSLKSLQFGNDTPGGGSSGLPYIQNGLPEDSPAGEYLAGIARDSMDWPLRGGTYSTIASTTDSIRISRFLTDLPRGYVFTSKQVQLQKSNPKIETGGFASRLNTQTYNLNANLLAQVFEQGTGIHIPRPGANTNELGPDNPQAKYEWIVSHKNTDQNRLVALYGTKIQQNSAGLSLDSAATTLGISTDDNILFDYEMGPDSLYGDGNTTIFRTTNTTTAFEGYISKGFTKTQYNPLFKTLSSDTPYNSSYIASLYNTSNVDAFIQSSLLESQFGIPSNTQVVNLVRDEFNSEDNTNYQQSSPDYIRPEFVPIGTSPINYFGNTMGYSALLAAKGNDLAVFGKTQDFRSNTNDPTAQALANSVSYNTFGPNGNGFKMESRIGIGTPGARPSNKRNSFYNPFPDGQDKINMSPIYRRSIDTPVEQDDPSVRDLIKFCIEAIDNGYPNETNRMHFRAYITNFSDNIGAEWDAKKYMGRGENFYTYQGFTRDVGFTFIVAAQSVQEMEKIYQKVNYLASTLHPDYEVGTGFMRGSLHKLTIGEYFYRTTGIITSMNITVDDNYPWEIKMRQPEDELLNVANIIFNNNDTNLSDPAKNDRGQMEVPQILKIQMNFKPIMDKLPQRGLKEPIIVSEKIANNYLQRKDFEFAELGKKATAAPTPASTTPTSTPPLTNTDTTTPAVTTATNDVNTAPAVTTTTTQAPPANSWVPGEVVPGVNGEKQVGDQIWTAIVRKAALGYFGWQVTNPDGSTTSSPSGTYSTANLALDGAKEYIDSVSG